MVALAALGGASSCVDGRSPSDLDILGTASFSIVPVYAPGPQPAEGTAPVNRIRIVARLEKDNSVLATFVVDVDPNASEWDLNLEIPIPAGGGSVILTIELVNVAAGGAETVQWSGQSPPVPLTPGQPAEVKEVQVVRGSTDNLTVTGINVTPDSARIPEGSSVQLVAAVTTNKPDAKPTVYWASLDTTVATVSATGLVQARLPGTARIVGQSGKPADTSRVTVTAVPRGVTIAPASVTLDAPGKEATFTSQVVDARGSAIGGQQVTWRSLNPLIAESLGGGRFRARTRGQTQVEARSVSDPGLAATATFKVEYPEADLSLDKGSQVSRVAVGDVVAFTVTVTNRGPDAAGGFTVKDEAPSGLTYVDGSAPTGSVSSDSLLWHVPGLAVGASITWRLDFRVDAADQGEVTNRAEILTATTRDPDGENNRDSHPMGIARDADVGVSISAIPASVLRGDTLWIRVRVANEGPARAQGVRVAVPIPAGLERRQTVTSEGSFDAASGVWTVGELRAGASAELYHGVRVTDAAEPEITVEADWARFAPATDPASGNNVARALIRVTPATVDLTVAKRFGRSTILEDDTVTWTVSVLNRGPAVAREVRIADSLDVAGFTGVALLGSSRMTSIRPGAGRDTLVVDSLAPGDTSRVEFRGVARRGMAGRTLWNRAHIASISNRLVLTETADDADSASVAVRSNVADLVVRKSVSRDSVYAGDTVRYVVTVRNRGPAAARRVEVLDTFDARLFRSLTVTRRQKGMTGALPGRLLTDSLAAGDSALVEVVAVPDSAAVRQSVVNRARVTSLSAARDTVAANDTASASVYVRTRMTDLAVRSFASKDTALVGDTVVYEVRVLNQGPNRVTAFQLEDVLERSHYSDIRVSHLERLRGSVPGVLAGDTLAVGQTARIVFAAVIASAAEGKSIANAASILSREGAGDTIGVNDRDSAVVAVRLRVPGSVTLTPASATAGALGDTLTFSAAVVDLKGQPLLDATYTWSVSNAGVLALQPSTVSTARVVAVGNGSAAVVVRATRASVTSVDSSFVTVAQAAASLVLTPASRTFTSIGDTMTAVAVLRDARGNVMSAPIAWTSSAPTVASVTPAGLITAIGNGTARIVAAAGAAADTVDVTVAVVPASLVIAPDTATLVVAGAILDLAARATARDARGNIITGATVSWTSLNATVATVTAAGIVTAVANGSAKIVATSGPAADTATVTVAIPAARVVVAPAADTVAAGGTVQFAATAYDAAGNVVTVPFSWSAPSASIATVSATGLASGVAAGTAPIVATSGAVADTAFLGVAGPGSLLATAFPNGSSRATVRPGDTVTVAVTLDMSRLGATGDLGSVTFELEYDPALLSAASAATTLSGTFATNLALPGRARIAFISASPQGSSKLTLATVKLVVMAAPVGSVGKLRLVFPPAEPPTTTDLAPLPLPVAVAGRIVIR